MGITNFFSRLFGGDPPEAPATDEKIGQVAQEQSIPPEKVGPDGEYDQSGLAKRVALAFDQNPDTEDFENLWVAQTASTVVLKGQVPTAEDLNMLVGIASAVKGATEVNVDEVTLTS